MFLSAQPRIGKVAVVSTGGTIASRKDPVTGALISVATGDELLVSLGALAPAQELALYEFSNVGSNLIDLNMSLQLSRFIADILQDEQVIGCVVTHGTDTLEESAFIAQLAVQSDKPVIFTGAQRSSDQPDADGPRNLADSIRVAASPDAADLGTLLVFNGQILTAIDATKIHTSCLNAFGSSGMGPVGTVDLDEVLITRKPHNYPQFPFDCFATPIDLITLTMGADDRLFEAAIASGAKAIILETFGRGNGTPPILEAIKRAALNGIVTVITSRSPEGRVLPLYADAGGRDLADAGAIFAGRMKGPQARILLSAALNRFSIDELRQLFYIYGR